MEPLWTEVVSGWRTRASDLALNAPRCPRAPRSGTGGSVYVCVDTTRRLRCQDCFPMYLDGQGVGQPPLGMWTRGAWAL